MFILEVVILTQTFSFVLIMFWFVSSKPCGVSCVIVVVLALLWKKKIPFSFYQSQLTDISVTFLSYSVNELNLYLLCGVSSDNDPSQPRSVLLNRQFSAQLNYGQTTGQKTKTLPFLPVLLPAFLLQPRQKVLVFYSQPSNSIQYLKKPIGSYTAVCPTVLSYKKTCLRF